MHRFLQILGICTLMLSQVDAGFCDSCPNPMNEDISNPWDLNVDFLWWRAAEDNLSSAVVIGTEGVNRTSAHVHNPNFKWDPGVRLGVGYRPCGCDWGLIASWTYFDTKTKQHLSLNSQVDTLAPEWGSLTPFSALATNLHTDWHMRLNWADLEMNKQFCAGSCFQFGFHGGLRAVWLEQKVRFSLKNANSINIVHSKSDFTSLGVVAGLDGRWSVGCGFSVNASAGGALLYGKNKSHFRENLTTVGNLSYLSGSSHYYISRAMTDLSLGIGWETPILDCVMLALAVDWEHHILFDQNHLPRGSQSANARPRNGDLTLQGATFSATLSF